MAMEMPNVPQIHGCICQYPAGCLCGLTERALRAWVAEVAQVPMTEEQRAWCVAEIRAVEGWSDYQLPVKDSVLANDVLSAWRDYVRDKFGAVL